MRTTFGERLLKCIADHPGGTTQAELARKAGVSSASVSEWATNKVQTSKIKAEPLLKAAAYFGVNPTWLLTGRGDRATHSNTVLVAADGGRPFTPWPLSAEILEVLGRLDANERRKIENGIRGQLDLPALPPFEEPRKAAGGAAANRTVPET